MTAALYYSGPIGTCDVTPDAYWQVAGRCISKTDTLYLSTPTRAVGLLLGSAFAMVWRPAAVMRGPMRERGPLARRHRRGRADRARRAVLAPPHRHARRAPTRGCSAAGSCSTGFATLAVIAAVTHRRAAMGTLLGNPVFVWIGTRSYGLYLYHWPIFQGIRRVAGNVLTLPEFIVAMIATGIVAELSYRYIETPVRRGALGRAWSRLRHGGGSDTTRRTIAVGAAALVVVVGVAGASLATAENKPNAIERAGEEGAEFTGDPFATTTTIAGAHDDGGARRPSRRRPWPRLTRRRPPSTARRRPRSRHPPVSPAPTAAATAVATTAAPPPPIAFDPNVNQCELTPIPKLAIGDSVMVGAAAQLSAAGFCVDAEQSRAFIGGIDDIQQLHAVGKLGQVVVVALGTNGPIGNGQLTAMMNELAQVPTVVMVTTKADRDYVARNNARIREMPATWPNVKVVDWEALAANCPGQCFYEDGIHLPPDGRNYYAQQIVAVTG